MTTHSLSSLIGRVRELDKAANDAIKSIEPTAEKSPERIDALMAASAANAERDKENRTLLVQLADAAERMQVAAGRAHEAVCLPGHSSPCCKCNQEVQQILGEALGREFLTVEEWEEADKEHWEMLSARVAELEGQIAEQLQIIAGLNDMVHGRVVTLADMDTKIQALERCSAYLSPTCGGVQSCSDCPKRYGGMQQFAAPSRPDTEPAQ